MKTTPTNPNTEIKKAVKFPLDTMDNDRVREGDVATKPIDIVFIGEDHTSASKEDPLFDTIESQLKDGKKVSCSMEYINADNSRHLKPNGLCELDVEGLKVEIGTLEALIIRWKSIIILLLNRNTSTNLQSFVLSESYTKIRTSVLKIIQCTRLMVANKKLLELKEKYGPQLTVQLLQVCTTYQLFGSSHSLMTAKDEEAVTLRDHEMACELAKLMNSDKKIDSIVVIAGMSHLMGLSLIMENYQKNAAKNINIIDHIDATNHQKSSVNKDESLALNLCNKIWEDIVKQCAGSHMHIQGLKDYYYEAIDSVLYTIREIVPVFNRPSETPENIMILHGFCSPALNPDDAEALLKASLTFNFKLEKFKEDFPKKVRSGSWTSYEQSKQQHSSSSHMGPK